MTERRKNGRDFLRSIDYLISAKSAGGYDLSENVHEKREEDPLGYLSERYPELFESAARYRRSAAQQWGTAMTLAEAAATSDRAVFELGAIRVLRQAHHEPPGVTFTNLTESEIQLALEAKTRTTPIRLAEERLELLPGQAKTLNLVDLDLSGADVIPRLILDA